jgi:hypothetical protein
VGLWLVTQSPPDVPESVLGQLGNRVHHALRAYTPKDRKAVDSVAANLRPNPKVDAAAAITELGVGEALVSFLDAEGRPAPVERVRVVPPASRVGAVTPEERAAAMAASAVGPRYARLLDRESAYEMLKGTFAPGGGPAGRSADAFSGAGSGAGAGAGTRAQDGRSAAAGAGAGAGYGAGGGPGRGAAREPTIEEIEAELRGFPVSRRGAPEDIEYPGYSGPGDGAEAGSRTGAREGYRAPGNAPRPREASGRPSRGAGDVYGRQPATGASLTGGGLAAELARVALTAAGRELGRQAARGLLGTRRRRR